MQTQSKKHLRRSGILVAILFNLIFFILPFLFKKDLNYFVLISSILIILISILSPYALRRPLLYWQKFGNFAARINSTLILGIFFYFLILPASILRFLIKKITLYKTSSIKSYYIKSDPQQSNLKDQF